MKRFPDSCRLLGAAECQALGFPLGRLTSGSGICIRPIGLLSSNQQMELMWNPDGSAWLQVLQDTGGISRRTQPRGAKSQEPLERGGVLFIMSVRVKIVRHSRAFVVFRQSRLQLPVELKILLTLFGMRRSDEECWASLWETSLPHGEPVCCHG